MAPRRGPLKVLENPKSSQNKKQATNEPSNPNCISYLDPNAKVDQEAPPHLQQSLLQTFASAFPSLLSPSSADETLQPLLQRIKHHLYHRNFKAAFGEPELLEAYAVRWSASRALAYLDIFRETFRHVNTDISSSESPKRLEVTCLGGGAGAELVALAGLQRLTADSEPPTCNFHITAIDIADWSRLLSVLHATMLKPPLISPYASPAARAANTALLTPDAFRYDFHQTDLLSLFQTQQITPPRTNQTETESIDPINTISINRIPTLTSLSNANLITLMFTLNELYATSRSLTQSFLLNLTDIVATGTFLLVVDSPGSYSTVAVGASNNARTTTAETRGETESRKYPMSWLLHHALLHSAGSPGKPAWERLVSEESRWFRLPGDGKGNGKGKGDGGPLRYSIPLENMRYQMHLYRRV